MTTTAGDQDGTEIRRLRQARGLTLGQLAPQVGLHPASLTNIERGRKPASLDVLVKIADALDVSLRGIVQPGTTIHKVLSRAA